MIYLGELVCKYVSVWLKQIWEEALPPKHISHQPHTLHYKIQGVVNLVGYCY